MALGATAISQKLPTENLPFAQQATPGKRDFSRSSAQGASIRYGYLQLIYHTGIYWSRTEYLKEQFENGYRALEARFGLQTDGSQYWQQVHDFPRYGFGLHYSDLVIDREDTLVGNAYSAFVFYGAPWVRFGRFTFNTDLSLGLSYNPLIHDPVTNPYNDVIASHINLYFDFNLNIYCALTNRVDIHAGYGVTHYSNGRIHQPQKGVNHWGWNFGMNYHVRLPRKNMTPDNSIRQNPDSSQKIDFPGCRGETPREKPRVRPEFIKEEGPEFQPEGELQLMIAVGTVDAHELGKLKGVHYLTSSFTADYAFQFNPRMQVTFGIDALYDGSMERAIKGLEPDMVTTFQKTYLGSHMGYQFLIDRVTILGHLGTYFLQHSKDRGFWFIRAGGRIRITDHLHGHICLKTKNGARADWIEWGLVTYLKI